MKKRLVNNLCFFYNEIRRSNIRSLFYTKNGGNQMNVEKVVLVLGMVPYSFKNDDKELVEGLTVHYVALDEKLDNGLGVKPSKTTLEHKEFGKYQFQEFPCLATLKGSIQLTDMKLRIDSFTDFEPINAVD